MNTRYLALAAFTSLVVGCADEGRIPIPQKSEPFGSADDPSFQPVGDVIPSESGVTYAALVDADGRTIFSMWRIGYQSSYDVRYCRAPVSEGGEWYCRAWESWKIEGIDLGKFSRPESMHVAANIDGQDQFVTMELADANGQSHRRDCYVVDGTVDFGQCSDWSKTDRGGI